MHYFIGIDGGGTKTKGILTDNNLHIIKTVTADSSNPYIVGFKKSSVIISGLIKKLYKNGVNVTAGISGAGRKKDADKIKSLVKINLNKLNIEIARIEIYSDARIALEGAFPGRSGMLLIAGTGSILYYKDSDNNFSRVGGFGRYVGDEGSGYSIGRKGLNIAAKTLDKRISKNILADRIIDSLKISNIDDFITKIHADRFDFSSIAPIVIESAQKGDKISKKILDDETDELISHISIALTNIDEKKVPLCLSGGLISNKNYYSKLLIKKIKSRFNRIIIQEGEFSPEIGAILLTKKLFTDKSE